MMIYLALMAEAFMGYLLPWGQMSYWGAQVIISLFGAIPVIGNGDVTDAASAEALVEQTGCDGIMIGRGAEGNPWIFKQILHYMETGETLARPTQHEVKEMMLRHARMQVEYKGGAIGIREMRKHVAWYTAGFPHSAKLRAAINQVESLQALEQMLNEWERG